MAVQDIGNGKVRVLCYSVMATKTSELNPEGWATSVCLWSINGFKPLAVVPIKFIDLEDIPALEYRYYVARSFGNSDSCGTKWIEMDKEVYTKFMEENSVEAFCSRLKKKRLEERASILI